MLLKLLGDIEKVEGGGGVQNGAQQVNSCESLIVFSLVHGFIYYDNSPRLCLHYTLYSIVVLL